MTAAETAATAATTVAPAPMLAAHAETTAGSAAKYFVMFPDQSIDSMRHAAR
ncbi:hypothetical protein [Rhodococcoides fascians]|uniref:hypothetical protein n=1 Tax=Rhodococcoides fascians TaxID=1828 RepID=UPI000A6FAF9A|nr:hypothetical protein [Rhodococcus fascians]WQH30164.1 hypothetical protein U2G91_09630 [Rhodococcus fascians]